MPEVTAAVVTLSRRDGAASLPQDTFSRFESPEFRDAFRAFAQGHQVLGLVLVELERGAAGRLSPAVTAENRQHLRAVTSAREQFDVDENVFVDFSWGDVFAFDRASETRLRPRERAA